MLRFEFELTGAGCAQLAFDAGCERVEFEVGDATDPLGDLGRALAHLATGGSHCEVLVLGDDLEHRIRMRRAGHDGLHLEILRAEGCSKVELGIPCRLVLRAVGSLSGLATDYADSLARIARSHGIAGYEAMWGAHPFPRRPLEILQKRYSGLR